MNEERKTGGPGPNLDVRRNRLHSPGSAAEQVTIKATIARQIRQIIVRRGMSKAELAGAMKTSRSQIDRLLDPANTSISMHTLYKAAAVFGKKLRIELVDRDQ